MPELPEVETIRFQLNEVLKGARIWKVGEISDRFNLPFQKIKGKTVEGVRRHGKYLFIGFNDYQLVVHLGMSGYFRLSSAKLMEGADEELHDHWGLEYTASGKRLIYVDPRRFGYGAIIVSSLVRNLIDNEDFKKGLPIFNLGPDALCWNLASDTLSNRVAFWNKMLKSDSRSIKQVLMDQSVVAGIGNIYGDEILFKCRVNPLRSASSMLPKEVISIAEITPRVLKNAIQLGGSTTKGSMPFRDLYGNFGRFEHNSYGRANKPCLRCKGTMKRSLINGRSTVYCDSCQI